MLGRALVRSENVRAFAGRPNLQPDILIAAEGRAPVIVEAEYLPARNVEREARSRLGLMPSGESHRVESAIALRYPVRDLREEPDLTAALARARLSYCLLSIERYTDPPKPKIASVARFPEAGWLEGTVADLADLIRLASVPHLAAEEAADTLQEGIDRVAAVLDELERSRPAVNPEIAQLLGMDNVPQTRRMAGAIIADAMVFHQRISGIHTYIKPPAAVSGHRAVYPQADTLAAWDEILKINYWPIFDIASRILAVIPAEPANIILRNLEYVAGQYALSRVNNSHDLTGRVFQRLIADRKYLATFYTRPASAALLARLAVAKLEGVDWADAEAIGRLRVGDFACGTGALLAAVYEQIAARHERAGGSSEAIHQVMMEEALYGCDVMPSAVHITSATLSGAQPKIGFNQSRLYTMPYGRLSDGSVAIGSLEFLNSNSQLTLSNFSAPARRSVGNGDERSYQATAEVIDETFDLVIMNPPFTRATNHEGPRATVSNPVFAAFNAEKPVMNAMGNRLNQLGRNSCYHGNAGVASAFAALADKKLKPGGVLALVLPLSAASGLSWQGFRQTLADGYEDLTVMSIAANGQDMSFSSDTGMGECLVTARKRSGPGTEPGQGARPQFISFTRRPQSLPSANLIAESILGQDHIWEIEGGPQASTFIMVGDELTGQMLTIPRDEVESQWGTVRLQNVTLAQYAYALARSTLWSHPNKPTSELPVAPLGQVGRLGLVDRDITGPRPRGPFDRTHPNANPERPALWNHNARQETRLVCLPDSSLRGRPGMAEKANDVWATASRAHLNRDFTFGSQALAVAFTETASIGGRVWPNVIFADSRFDYAFSIWGNSTLGLFCYWWHSNRQQSSKAGLTIRSAETLPVLDFRTLTDEQLAKVEEIFEEFRDKELLPAYLSDADPNRDLLDRRVICDLLGFDEFVYEGVRSLAQRWCNEPSVHGGKARPKDATLVSHE
jgi:methylase of polypeptide subunit release factors